MYPQGCGGSSPFFGTKLLRIASNRFSVQRSLYQLLHFGCRRLHEYSLASRFLRRQLEIDEIAAEAAGFPCADGNANCHPESADDPGFGAEVPPEDEANEETQEWRKKIGQLLFLFTDEVANKGGGIHAHESNQRAEIQQVSSQFVARRR